MTIKRRDFQKAAALLKEFALKLNVESDCAELRDALNLALLHMQRYYHSLRNKVQAAEKSNGSNILSASLRGLSPMTPFRDAPDKFQWKWINLDSTRVTGTLPADLRQSFSSLPLIIQAAKDGDNDFILQLVNKDASSIYEQDAIGRSALVYAVHFKHQETVQILLEQGAEVNCCAHDGSSAAHRACHDDNFEALQLLIDARADLQIQDSQGRAPIHWACTTKGYQCLQLLIEQNVDVNVRDREGLTPSMWACRLDNIDHFGQLSAVENQNIEDEDGFERDDNGRTWMHWSVRRTEPQECLKTLLTDESAQIQDRDGKTVILTAAEQGSLPAMQLIIEITGKQYLEDRDNHNRTALILATMAGHGEIVNYLLSQGADLYAVDNFGATAWNYAQARQLHYCMLIIASYIRQEAKTEQDPRAPVDVEDEMPSYSEHIGDSVSVVPAEPEDTAYFHGHRPQSTPHPPAEPPTPRTPRGQLAPATPRQSQSGNLVPHTPQGAPPISPRSNPSIQRSSSAPGVTLDRSEGSQERSEISSAGSGGSKRKKSDMESSDEDRQIYEAQAVQQQQGQGHYPVTRPQSTYQQPEYHDNDEDVDNVSLGGMDVSDLEGEGDDEAEAEPMMQSSPPGRGRVPQPHPRGGQQSVQSMEYEHPHGSAPVYIERMEDQDNQDSSHPPGAPTQSDQSQVSQRGAAMPPAHLSPLPPRSPTHKVKKKKKKRREGTEPELPPPRGYVAPIPPPLHTTHPAYTPGRELSPSRPIPGYRNDQPGYTNHGQGSQSGPANAWPNQSQSQGSHDLGHPTKTRSIGPQKPPTKKWHSLSPPNATLEHEQKFALNDQMKATKPIHSLPGQSPRAPPLPNQQGGKHQQQQQQPSPRNQESRNSDPQWSDEQPDDDDDWDNRQGSGQRWMKGQQMSAGQGQPRVSSGHVRFSTNTQGNSPVPAPRERESRHYIHHNQGQGDHALQRRKPPSGQGHRSPSPRSQSEGRRDKGHRGVPPISNTRAKSHNRPY